jgi:transposase
MKNKFKPDGISQLFLLPPSVEDFIPENHLARLIDEIVNGLGTEEIEAQYSYLGQKSYHPKSLVKLWIYGYATGTFSGRKIAANCESDTAYMFLASMYRPDFRTINDFRKDNLTTFSKYFVDVLKICRKLGMANVGTVAIDGTKIRANAATHRTKDKQGYQQWLQRIDHELEQLHQKAESINKEEDRLHGEQRGDELPKAIEGKQQLKEKVKQAVEQLSDEDEKINLTDADAKPIRSGGRIQSNYNCQGAVSMDGFIVAAYATTAASDKEQLIEAITQTQQNVGEKPQNILADSGYSSYQNYEWLQQQNLVAYIPDQELKQQTTHAQEPYHRNHFVYDAQRDCYTCPQNQPLVFSHVFEHKKKKQKSKVYTGLCCNKCPVRSACTGAQYRTIHQEFREPLRQQARDRLSSEEGKNIYQQRMYTIEPRWANIKFNRKFRMFQLRSLKKVNAEFKLMCLAENILTLHRKNLQKAS